MLPNKELQFLIYNTPQENIKVDVVVKDETIWLTQKAMAALFNVGVPAISKHIKNIFAEGELQENTTISKMETVVNRGFRGEINEKVAVSILEITTQHGAMTDKTQKIISDFDKHLKALENKQN